MYRPSEIYYHAPEDVRDGLIARLLETEDSRTAGNLMCCLAMQGDDKALETLYELEQNPRPWREKLYVGPSVYAQCGGWTHIQLFPPGIYGGFAIMISSFSFPI